MIEPSAQPLTDWYCIYGYGVVINSRLTISVSFHKISQYIHVLPDLTEPIALLRLSEGQGLPCNELDQSMTETLASMLELVHGTYASKSLYKLQEGLML